MAGEHGDGKWVFAWLADYPPPSKPRQLDSPSLHPLRAVVCVGI